MDLLKEFRSFCENNGIRYFLAHGTLLGAIRYKGFIPWDDDVDVLVPREDYEQLIRIFEDHGIYRLYSIERDKKYGYPFAKLCNNATRKIEASLDNGVVQGVELDIFPLDHWADDVEEAKKEVRRLKKKMFWLRTIKNSSPTAKTPFRLFVLKMMIAFGRLLGSRFFINGIIRISYRKKQAGSAFMGNKSWCPYGEKDICPSEVFSGSTEVEFEGDKYPAPIGYDEYLTRLYGDYLPEPPKEKQKTHHVFKAYRLASSETQGNE
ncbi:MAG: LicD family protein [Clostridia bacterium]|nr:LicD family protein [Clostridia bacterium]